jgi:uncharacterized membrane protein YdjX (TVP38/TMEM64 family)
MENQYLTSASVGEAMAARLQEKNGPEIVIVLPQKSSGWLESTVMDTLRARLLRRLREKDRFGRLRVYYPAAEGVKDGIYVHAKVMVVDDALIRVGSANLSNRSMGLDTECDLAVEAAGEGRIEEAIAGLRDRLLGEHLGHQPETIRDVLAEKRSLIETVEGLRGSRRSLETLPMEVPEWLDDVVPDTPIFDPERPISADDLTREFVPEEVKRSKGQALWRVAGILLIMLGLAAAWRWTPLGGWLDVQTLVAWAGQLRGHSAAAFIVIGAYLVGGVLFFPVTVLILATALIFELWAGFAYSLIGCHLSAAATYGLGALIGRETIMRLKDSRLNRLSRSLANYGVLTIISLRVVPVAPFTLINIVAGASHIRFRDFVLGTFLGMTPGITAISIFGHQLEVAIRDPNIESFAILGSVILVTALAALAVRRWLRSKNEPHAQSADEKT